MEQSGDKVGGVPAVRPAAEAVITPVQLQAGGVVVVERTAGKAVADVQAVKLSGGQGRYRASDRLKDIQRHAPFVLGSCL